MTLPVMHAGSETLVLTGQGVRDVLDLRDCIDAVEQAFIAQANGRVIPAAVLGVHVEGGGFHLKTAGLFTDDGRPVFAAKLNANFPGNPARYGLPTIQGVLALFDAADGRVLAIMDSAEITRLRTAAATAVAAKYLANPGASVVTICGCGAQAASQLQALATVRPLQRVMAFDTDHDRATQFARSMTSALGVSVTPTQTLGAAADDTDLWVTCTPSHQWFLGQDVVRAGAFVAAVGADHPHKQEIEPALLAASAVVVDVLEQCATIGDLHHALAGQHMQRSDVRAELAEVVVGQKVGRASHDEITIFDSTGTALEDVAAALRVCATARASGTGMTIVLHDADDRSVSP